MSAASCASPSLTHRMRSAQREPNRSHPTVAVRSGPVVAWNDQPCGWNTVGREPRIASRPASPALLLPRWTRSGLTAWMMRRSRRTSPSTLGPGERVASHACSSAPSPTTVSANGLGAGHATTVSKPRPSWSATSEATQLAAPSVTGWLTCRTFIGTPSHGGGVHCPVPAGATMTQVQLACPR